MTIIVYVCMYVCMYVLHHRHFESSRGSGDLYRQTFIEPMRSQNSSLAGFLPHGHQSKLRQSTLSLFVAGVFDHIEHVVL